MQGEYGGYHGDVTAEQLEGRLITPGFVDIHCHSALDLIGYEEPAKVASHFLQHGSTSMLLSLYRVLSPISGNNHAQWQAAVSRNIYEIFLEPPRWGTGHAMTCSTSGMGLRLK